MKQLLIAVALNTLALLMLATEGRTQTMDPFSRGYYGGFQGLVAPAPVQADPYALQRMERHREIQAEQQRRQQERFNEITTPSKVYCHRTLNGSLYCERSE